MPCRPPPKNHFETIWTASPGPRYGADSNFYSPLRQSCILRNEEQVVKTRLPVLEGNGKPQFQNGLQEVSARKGKT
jgi:hypothetical protein